MSVWFSALYVRVFSNLNVVWRSICDRSMRALRVVLDPPVLGEEEEFEMRVFLEMSPLPELVPPQEALSLCPERTGWAFLRPSGRRMSI